MCGIAGIVDLKARREIPRDLLARMNDSIAHRGPDGDGMHFEPGVGLAHRRLAIIDLSGGRQPLGNEDDSVLVTFNGEIYNFESLTQELLAAGHRFRTHSDTEVIVHAWEQWGERCVERFNGMFAFAIWDRNTSSLFLARDRLGKKPLYYSLLPDGHCIFASELKALLVHPALPRRMDPTAVEDYFALGYVPDPKCILASVQKLAPASTLVLRHGAPPAKPRIYWDVKFDSQPAMSDADLQAQLIERLRSVVRSRLISEVPLGAFLSGGVDSSAVVAMMAQISAEPVRTCSIAFTDPAYDESRYAALAARQFKTDHHVETVDPADFSLLGGLAEVYDEPFADSSALPTYRVCQLARRHVTVALSGDGGDETFAGYRRYRLHMHEERVRNVLPLGVRRPLFGALGRAYPKLDWAPRFLRAKATLLGLSRDSVDAYLQTVSLLRAPDRARMFSKGFTRDLQGYNAIQVFRDHASRAQTDDPLSLVQYLDFKTYLPGDILTKVDRASMAHALEVRAPFLDYELVQWAASLPAHQKLRGNEGKYVLKKALEPLVPNELLYRKKMGFAVPLDRWFRGPLRERVRQEVLEGALAQTGMFEMRELERLVNLHQAGVRDYSPILWALMMFDGSCRRVLDMPQPMALSPQREWAATGTA
jgi:asparagine synthase (glutamine-hydrolysing)